MIMAGEALDSDAMPVLSWEQLIAMHRGAVPTLSSLPGRINKDTIGGWGEVEYRTPVWSDLELNIHGYHNRRINTASC